MPIFRLLLPAQRRTAPLLLVALAAALCALLVDAHSARAQDIWHVDAASPDKPILYLKFDEGVGTVVHSFPAITLTGALPSASVYSTTLPPALTPPNFHSLQLDGTQVVTVTDDAELNLANNFTVAAWVRRRPADINTASTLYDAGTAPGTWFVGFRATNHLAFTTDGVQDFNSTHVVADSNWHHIAFTKNGSSVVVYLDGAAAAPIDVEPTVPVPAPSGIKLVGGKTTNSLARLDGQVDELRFYNRVLSTAEIQRLAQGHGCASDGASWNTAFFDLQCALNPNVVGAGDAVRVATGVYRPGLNTLAHFRLISGVQVLGGWVTDGAGGATRPPFPLGTLLNPVFPIPGNIVSNLSGDLLANDANAFANRADNAALVVLLNDANAQTLLDGFAVGGAATLGGIRSLTSDGTLSNLFVTLNRATASSAGGGIGFLGGTSTVTNVALLANQAKGGGGIALRLSSTVSIENTRVLSNTAGEGGGIVVQSSSLTMGPGVLVQGNVALSGGGLALTISSDAVATGATFRNNQANVPGIDLGFSLLIPSRIDGGGISVDGESTLALTDSVVEQNRAVPVCITPEPCRPGNGAGLFLGNGARLQMTGGTITRNLAGNDGAGLFAGSNAQITLANLAVRLNNAAFNGGGLRIEAGTALTMSNTLVEENHARQAGGLQALDAGLALTDVTFRRNTTSDQDAGLLLVRSTLHMVGGAFVENRAGDDSGGAGGFNDARATFDRVAWLGNIADQEGGAFTLGGSATSITVTNGIFAGNSVSNSDPRNKTNVVAIQSGTLRLINSTVAGNTGVGAAAFEVSFGGDLIVDNSVLWDNKIPFTTTSPNSTVTVRATTIGPGGTDPDPLLVRLPNSGDGDWATFADNDYGDLHLRLLSPVIDQGDGSLLPPGIALDAEGQPRVFDANYRPNPAPPPVDRGALEARFVGPTAHAGGPYVVNEGIPLALNGSASSDDAPLTQFAWDCTDDGTIDVTATTPLGSTCTYPDNGNVTLRLRITDTSGLASEATAAVTVNNVPPVAGDDTAALPTNGGPAQINVLSNDTDVVADPLTVTTTTEPAQGTVTLSGGTVTYTPGPGFPGSDSFAYTVSDGDGGTDTATVTISGPADSGGNADFVQFLPAIQK